MSITERANYTGREGGSLPHKEVNSTLKELIHSFWNAGKQVSYCVQVSYLTCTIQYCKWYVCVLEGQGVHNTERYYTMRTHRPQMPPPLNLISLPPLPCIRLSLSLSLAWLA